MEQLEGSRVSQGPPPLTLFKEKGCWGGTSEAGSIAAAETEFPAENAEAVVSLECAFGVQV